MNHQLFTCHKLEHPALINKDMWSKFLSLNMINATSDSDRLHSHIFEFLLNTKVSQVKKDEATCGCGGRGFRGEITQHMLWKKTIPTMRWLVEVVTIWASPMSLSQDSRFPSCRGGCREGCP